MSRIRSTHPGQWTDDQFVSCSPLARLLAIAVRNYADDHGVFEWNPVKIRMLCLPGDNCDAAELLAELVATKQVESYEINGKRYGIVRNFGRFQSPKKPKYLYPTPPEFDTGTEPVPNQDGTGEEIAPQRDIGEGSKEEGASAERTETEARAQGAPAKYAFEGKIIRLSQRDFDEWKVTFHSYPDLAAELRVIDERLVEQGHTGKAFGKVAGWLRAGHEKRLVANCHGQISDAEQDVLVWRSVLTAWQRGGQKPGSWPENRGMPPGVPGCRVPEHLLAELGIGQPERVTC